MARKDPGVAALMAKLAIRDPELHSRLAQVSRPQPHPLFRVVTGDVETWEKNARPRRVR